MTNAWSYDPSPAAAIIFLVLFAIALVWQVVIMVRSKSWYFMVLIIGCILELAGYIFRYLATRDLENMTFFILQTLLILVAPALIAASIYMVLGRMIVLLHAESYSPIRPNWLTKIFVLGDLLSFLVQVAGSGLLSSNYSTGKMLIVIGLVAQLVFFGLFVTVAALVTRRLSVNPTAAARQLDSRAGLKHSNGFMGGWMGIMRVVFFASALIFIRSLFRLVEFTGNQDSPLQTSEAFLYICDSLLMAGVAFLLCWFHPSEYMPSKKDAMLLTDQEMS